MTRSAPPHLLALAALLLAPAAAAQTHVQAPAGGGLPALDVEVDLKARKVLVRGGRDVPIDPRAAPEGAEVVAEAVEIEQGKHVAHVRVRPRGAGPGDLAWEAVLAAGLSEPLFAGLTGYVEGDPGERHGPAVEIIANGATRAVLVGTVREDLGICGQDRTLLDPEAVYPSLDLRPATAQRLDPERVAGAEPIRATRKGAPADVPLARLLVATGSSVSGSLGAPLTDGKVDTV